MIFWLFVFLAGGYVLLALTRYLLALQEIRGQRTKALTKISESDVTVLQPILGGDPTLSRCLEENLRNAPDARFIWLLDEEDAEGLAAAEHAVAATGRTDVLFRIAPTPPQGLNPKTHKLARGLRDVSTGYCAVLDDDAVLPPGSLARAASLATEDVIVTGLPTYRPLAGLWSKLVSGFVNANSALTYLPASRLGLQKTINGMFSVMRVADLKKRGGFEAIIGEVTDDYALARLFHTGGGRIMQTTIWLSISTTVTGPAHYSSLMRRWMLFASLYLRDNISLGTVLLVLLPGLLPLPMLVAGACLGAGWLAFAVLLLAGRLLLARDLLLRLCGKPILSVDILFEFASELILPVHVLTACVRPQRIRWRTRDFVLDGRRIIGG